ncbi:MAG: membrane protein insertase YidC [Bacteroidetes bacterium HGW-Bacteroidetes-4]|jgi:YidC/Oxa1 family membrane protein insertase|nr:MAG: membrane protein insertase YidC [Bacteroidetes bacterium HGW-Bacteroidetes-4]
MDKNSWIGLVLIVGVLFTWSYFTRPTEQQIAEQRRQDSIAQIERERNKQELVIENQQKQSPVISANETGNTANTNDQLNQFYGDFAPAAKGEREFYTAENDLIKLQFSNKGGRIYSAELKNYKKYDGTPLILFSGDSTEFGLNFFAKNRSIATNNLFFELVEGTNGKVVTDKAETFAFRLMVTPGKYVEYRYTINPESYVVDFDIKIEGLQADISTNTGYLTLNWKSYITGQEKGRSWEETNSTVFYKFHEADVESLNMRSDSDQKDLTTPVKWISFKQQFFNVALIADNYFSNALVKTEKEVINPNFLKQFSASISLPYDAKQSLDYPMSFYFGPNHYKTLRKMDIDLERVIELGMSIIRWVNVGLVIPLFNFLGKYMGNYGLIILLMTIIIKLLIFPFTYKSYMSTAKMKALKPEVDKISEKFPKQEDAMKKQQATMALYKKVGVSPMGGCLPLLFQMPLLIAMFRFFPNSIELRQEAFLWATDLSTYDAVINLPFTVPFGFGDHISLWCLLMTVVNIVYMKFNDQMSMSNQKIPGMKMMMYMMPVMMLFWFNSYASALSYYYFLSLLITIIQTWAIRRTINDDEILAKLKAASANKKAPQKSKWQQRLEDMAKQKGYQPPKR